MLGGGTPGELCSVRKDSLVEVGPPHSTTFTAHTSFPIILGAPSAIAERRFHDKHGSRSMILLTVSLTSIP